jgi:chitodextrinase
MSNFKNRVHFSCILLVFLSVQSYSQITIGGTIFDNNAFADSILSTDYAGGFGCNPGYQIQGGVLDLEEAILGHNLDTWVEYDEPPPGIDPSLYIRNPLQYIEVGFIDNVVINLPGPDLVVFEQGSANGTYVSLSKSFNPDSSDTTNGDHIVAPEMWICYVDLSNLGVPEGDTINRLFLSNYEEIQDGRSSYPIGVAEIAGVAALHSGVPVNKKPSVCAGSNKIISFPVTSVMLEGTVSNDGLPRGTGLTSIWSQTSGPSGAYIANAYSSITEVSFTQAGTYQFNLNASDGELDSNSVVEVIVTEQDIIPPSPPSNLQLISAIEKSVKLQWTEASDNVFVQYYDIYRNDQFLHRTSQLYAEDISALGNTTYQYYVIAIDNSGNNSLPSGEISMLVPAKPVTIQSRIVNGMDDIEEFANGQIQTNSSDLELVYEVGTPQNQIIGLRFHNMSIPPNAHILNAYIEFEVDEVSTAPASLVIKIEDSENAPPYTGAYRMLSSRATMPLLVNWDNVASWSVMDAKQVTPDISSLIQPIVNKSNWLSGNALSFSISGTGTRTAESVEGEAIAAPLLHVEYVVGQVVNTAPVVSAGTAQTVVPPVTSVTLHGTVTDDGLPDNSSLSVVWEQESGPQNAVFTNQYSAITDVSLPASGVYIFKLTGSDGELQSSATVTMTLAESDNTPPSIPGNLISLSSAVNAVQLSWSASTDNSGIARYEIFRDQTYLGSSTGTTFSDNTAQGNTSYVYNVEAVDLFGNRSGLSSSLSVTVTVTPTIVERRIANGMDDVEEFVNGQMQTNSSDLELVYEAGTPQNQIIGLRFPNLAIPQYAQITSAYIEFEVDEVSTAPTSLVIKVEDSDNAAIYTNTVRSVSSRSTSSLTVTWNDVASWSTVNVKHRSPDISSLIQYIVNKGAWVSGNALAISISGTGTRTAESVEGEATAAPLLHIEYVMGTPVNQAPVVSAGLAQTVLPPSSSATLQGVITDDGLPVNSVISANWEQVSGPQNAVFTNQYSAITDVSLPASGVYTFKLTGSDGELQSSATVTMTLAESDNTPPSIPGNLISLSSAVNAVQLSWSASTDNSGIARYEIFRDQTYLGSSTGTTFTDNTAQGNTSYVYNIEAVDLFGNRSGLSSSLSVTVTGTVAPVIINSRIVNGIDDVEEFANGQMQTNSSDLELVYEAGTPQNQIIGLRFPNLAIPQYAQITNAYIEFEVDEVSTGPASLIIKVEDTDNAPVYTNTVRSVSSRSTSSLTVNWNDVASWSTVNVKHRSPDISSLIQYIVNKGAWVSGNALAISISGTGTRTAESVEGEATAAPLLHIEYVMGEPVNQAPVVSAGLAQTVLPPSSSATLQGVITDDGLPVNSVISANWEQVSGPQNAVFTNQYSAITDVSLPASGVYTFKLTGSDGELQSSATVTMTLAESDNTPPSIPGNLISLSSAVNAVQLSWSASTDNSGIARYEIFRDQTYLGSSTGTTFIDNTARGNTSYVYNIEAVDLFGNRSGLSISLSVTVTVAPTVVERRITDGMDDVEEFVNGQMQTNSSDLELVYEAGTPQNQVIGLRFPNLVIPQNAQITNAYIEFEVDEVSTAPTSLIIKVEDSDNAAAYTNTVRSISSRLTVSSAINWDNIQPWSATDVKHRTPDISSLIQTIVNKSAWVSGNALAFSITGTGTRTAESVEGEATAAPLLHIEYVVGE